jgi:hypothetical protein
MLDLPIHPGVCHGCPIHADMVITTETEKLFADEPCAVVGDDGVWDPKVVNDVDEEEHRLLGLDLRNWSSLDPL